MIASRREGLPYIVSHLQRLNEKLSLNDSPHASLEIKCIATASPFGADSM